MSPRVHGLARHVLADISLIAVPALIVALGAMVVYNFEAVRGQLESVDRGMMRVQVTLAQIQVHSSVSDAQIVQLERDDVDLQTRVSALEQEWADANRLRSQNGQHSAD